MARVFLGRALLGMALASGMLSGCDQKTVASPFEAHDSGVSHDSGAAAVTDAGAADGSADPYGKACIDDGQCDDGIECTFDACVPNVQRCLHTPDHSRCADDNYCNGVEVCDVRLGCRPGAPVSCSDSTPCTVDRCVESDHSCVHEPRDADGDGDVDKLCTGMGDCDDSDPNISSLLPEICNNAIDDNCDGTIDETACQTPAYDTCNEPLLLTASGSFNVTTSASRLDYTASCISTDWAHYDLVFDVDIAQGDDVDVNLVATGDQADLALAGFDECGVALSENDCALSGIGLEGQSVARLHLAHPVPGHHTVVLFSNIATDIALSVTYGPVVAPATNETCVNAPTLEQDTPTIAAVEDSRRDIPSICGAVLGDLVYGFTLDEPRDVTLTAHSLDGYGVPQLSLEGAGCTHSVDSEMTCRQGDGAELFARALEAGTYYVVVGASGPSDVQVLLQTSAPSEAPADDTCAAPPALPHNQSTTVDLAQHTDAVFKGCLPGGVDAVHTLQLDRLSDVLLVERYPEGQLGAINLFDFPCTEDRRVACTVSDITPVRTAAHGLSAGTYAVVAESSLSSEITVTALTRPATAPTLVAFSDTCATALEIPTRGGFFQGNTANATADYSAGCDLPLQGQGGAKDQVLKLVLDKEQRVVLDMMGSGYSTLLAVRKGPDCPGTEVANACSLGVRGDRSYLDLTLPAGEYFVQIDGFAREEGQWFLDVYVVDP